MICFAISIWLTNSNILAADQAANTTSLCLFLMQHIITSPSIIINLLESCARSTVCDKLPNQFWSISAPELPGRLFRNVHTSYFMQAVAPVALIAALGCVDSDQSGSNLWLKNQTDTVQQSAQLAYEFLKKLCVLTKVALINASYCAGPKLLNAACSCMVLWVRVSVVNTDCSLCCRCLFL